MAATYRIRLKGHLDPIHEEWFNGLSMTLNPDGETVLYGQVADQAALYGVLLRIRDLGIPLLSVNEADPALQQERTDRTEEERYENRRAQR